ncbi:MAG: cupin domain-containing protein [Eubacteriales bacterium]|nr:cupin domain-containing protein [Eubacteriales bacterium]
MIIDFGKIPEKELVNFRGGEKAYNTRMFDDGINKIMLGRLVPGASIGLHTHDTSCEVIYFLSGTGKAIYDGITEEVFAGICHFCPKGHSHSLQNDGMEDLVFVAAVPGQ